MALIKCPNCNNDVSDMANACPSCGYEMKKEEHSVKLCPDCNAVLSGDETNCPKCGCPLIHNEEDLQKVEIASIKIKKDKKKRKKTVIIIVVIVLVLAIAGGIGAFVYQNYKEEERKRAEAEYKENIKTATSDMLIGAVAAESAGGLIHDVWYNAIFEKSDSKTNKYTKKSSLIWNDFNTALKNLYSDEDFSNIIQKIKTNQNDVGEKMKMLTNPPEGYEEAYSAIKDYYDAYLELTNLVIEPTGSLQTYTSNYNDADAKVSKTYSALKIYLED